MSRPSSATACRPTRNQTNIQPVYEVYASVQGRDLGSVATEIDKIVDELQKQLSPGNSIQVIGQIQSMNDAFRNLGIGLLFAAVFVYLLMVVNYQNFGDPVRRDPGVAGDASAASSRCCSSPARRSTFPR